MNQRNPLPQKKLNKSSPFVALWEFRGYTLAQMEVKHLPE